jgi:RimJ/RimL family protein N-acetyltransferase
VVRVPAPREYAPAGRRLHRHMSASVTCLLCLPDGARFTARPIRPGDKPALTRFFQRLSEESRRRRFLAPKPKLSARDLAFFTEVDHDLHVALVALDREGAIVGVARYATWPDHRDRAEIAFAVVDEWHGRGLGSALADRLVEHARRSGLAVLTASTLSENAAAHALLLRLGFLRVGASSGVAEYELALAGGALTAAA